jgi:hypothetical protein
MRTIHTFRGFIMRKLLATAAAGLVTFAVSAAFAATPFINLVSDDNQVAKAANMPVALKMSGDPTGGFKVDGSKITIGAAGDYFVEIAAQVGGPAAGNVYLWPRLNGKDIDDSNSIQYVSSPQFTAVLVSQGEMTFKAGDVLEFMIAGSAPGLGAIASKPTGSPTVPSFLLTIYKLP